MADTSEIGRDGAYRMTIEDKYKKIAVVRRDSKLLAVLSFLYGLLKLGLASVPLVAYGQKLDPQYTLSVAAIPLAFVIFGAGSGGGKPNLEKTYMLYAYVLIAAILGSKAVLDLFNNPLGRSLIQVKSAPVTNPYEQAVAKLLVQKLNLDPETAIKDVDMLNLVLEFAGSFVLLASSAATLKYLRLKGRPSKVVAEKKTS